MKRCAFLTSEGLDGFVIDDHHAIAPLQDRGWAVEEVPWRAPAGRWNDFDIVIVRSPWDYQLDPEAFDAALESIDRSRARLCNPLPLMRWNLKKTYLRDLERRGVSTLPTVWGRAPSAEEVLALFGTLDAGEIVIKPVIGANASDAFRLTAAAPEATLAEVVRVYCNREYLAQPFIEPVLAEGEYSLIYFGGALSHTILKTPKPGDFRVQEEHGGLIRPVQPSAGLLARAEEAMAALDEVPLYARTDFVRVGEDDFAIMEFELIEPSLYFRMDPASAERFADVVDRWYGS
jgi:glutathione synthase/RimK-type ligase-like ATP-grasp enzyme